MATRSDTSSESQSRKGPEEIRAALRTEAERKKKAKEALDRADAAIAALLRSVPETDGITVEEAAGEVGISRNMAYKMLRKHRH